MRGVQQRRPSAKENIHKDTRSLGLREGIEVSLELSFGNLGLGKKKEPARSRRYKIETPRLEPGRSLQRRYCTTTVMGVKVEKLKRKPQVRWMGLTKIG